MLMKSIALLAATVPPTTIDTTYRAIFRGRSALIGRLRSEEVVDGGFGYLAESSFISCEARTALTAESSSLVILRRLSA